MPVLPALTMALAALASAPAPAAGPQPAHGASITALPAPLPGTAPRRAGTLPRLAHSTGEPHVETPAPTPGAELREIVIELSPGAPAPVVTARRGEVLRVVIHGAPAGPLHLHGYDIEAAEAPDGTRVIVVEARHSGRFPAMTHAEDPVLGPRETAALYLEIAAP